MNQIIAYIESIFSKELTVFILAMVPFIESRGAVPIAMGLGLNSLKTAILVFTGSTVIIPFIILLIRPIFKFLKKYKLFKNTINKIIKKTMVKGKNVSKKGLLALVGFVAIPLPGTGVWSGSLLASLLDIRLKVAFPLIAFGNLISILLLVFLSEGIFSLFA